MEKLFHLSEVIDIDVLQNIQDSFANATGLGVVAVDYKGVPVTEYSNFSNFCRLIRRNCKCKERCFYSDAHGGLEAARDGRPHIYICHAGLVDFAIPIIVKGQYLGSIMAGQIKVKDKRYIEDKSMKDTIDIWEKNPEILEAYEKVPSISYKNVSAAADMMHIVANHIVEKGLASIYQDELNKKNMELLKETKIRSELEKALKNAELKALQSQLNPHFLFNVLNTIGRLALLEGAVKTEELVYFFSEMLRYTLKKSTKMVTLEDALSYIKKYLSIQKIRFPDRLDYSIDVPEDVLDMKLPFMTLQPFVENAVNHGIEPKKEGGFVNIIGKILREDLLIKIEDNGIGMNENQVKMILQETEEYDIRSTSTGIGIKNVNNMLINCFGEEYGVKIISKKNKGTTVKIKIPRINNSRRVLNV
ncbi:sensor histidine kinase [Maledivibacter halophilus]|uniref:histidine kinase n=1 Tax=Maledivibacter halophilus TaxID=36842 RepID=A0A1T5MVC4_9FIRM|nr:PocR ligand-binding domain-containing protein [Maledivibacter halophilus]SKC91808.1 Putative regulator of cell autolysis [Maledivibacter halophilus]